MASFAYFLASIALGSMVLFSAVVAPSSHRLLPRELAGRFIGALFAVYYPLIGTLAGLAAVTVPDNRAGLALGTVALAGFLGAFVLMPAANHWRDRDLWGDPAAGQRFRRLHRLALALNFAQLAVLAVVVWCRPA